MYSLIWKRFCGIGDQPNNLIGDGNKGSAKPLESRSKLTMHFLVATSGEVEDREALMAGTWKVSSKKCDIKVGLGK